MLIAAIGMAGFLGCATRSGVKDKEKADLHMQIGTTWLTKGKYPLALKELLLAEQNDSTNPIIQNNLGLTYFVMKRYHLAIKHLKRALDLNSKYTEARNNLGRVHIETGDYQRALAELSVVAEDLTYPEPEMAQFNLGLAKFKMGEYSSAQSYFLNSLEMKRDFCAAHAYYGRCFFEQKAATKAAKALDRAVLICRKSRYDEPQYFSALSYLQLGQTEKAASRLRELMDAYPNSEYARKAEEVIEKIRGGKPKL